MQVRWVESIPGGPRGLGHVHTNRQYYPDMAVKSMVGNQASYRSASTDNDQPTYMTLKNCIASACTFRGAGAKWWVRV